MEIDRKTPEEELRKIRRRILVLNQSLKGITQQDIDEN
jgi:hypothetical protein